MLVRPNVRRRARSLFALVATLVVLACTHPPPTGSPGIKCETTSQHHDGDTFACEPKGDGRFIVRVASVDAPETVCRLKTKDGQDASDVMLSEGVVWYPEDFAHEDPPADRERYRRLQAEAPAARRGLWAEPNAMSPKSCRQHKQAGRPCR